MNSSPENSSALGAGGPHAAPGHAAAPPGGPYTGAVPPQWVGAPPVVGRKSPALAGILSGFVPGLGQVYLGYYQRGFAHAMIFAGTVASLASGFARGAEPLFGIFLAFFYCYNIVDAVRRASAFNLALAGMRPAEMPEDFKMPSGRPSLLTGIIVTAIGLAFLLHTRFDFSLEWLADWWPAVLVLIGLNLVYKAMQAKKS